jgi:hypothetical protein
VRLHSQQIRFAGARTYLKLHERATNSLKNKSAGIKGLSDEELSEAVRNSNNNLPVGE